jgi:hypothetical protein
MKTNLDCLPCFLTQGLRAARLCVPEDADLHRRLLQTWAARLAEMDINLPPPAIAGELYRDVETLLGNGDPFLQDKKTANARVREILPRLESIVASSSDPLARALEISIIGNYIDSGVAREFPWEEELEQEARDLDRQVYERFRQTVEDHKEVMILGDNAGEIALDTILVGLLQERGCTVTYVVRGSPIINDATLEDAREVGMIELCKVVSSGVDTPGTVLSRCSQDFLASFNRSPVILSKGQGNLEALSDECSGIFYALKVKCPVVADMTGLGVGQSALIFM